MAQTHALSVCLGLSFSLSPSHSLSLTRTHTLISLALCLGRFLFLVSLSLSLFSFYFSVQPRTDLFFGKRLCSLGEEDFPQQHARGVDVLPLLLLSGSTRNKPSKKHSHRETPQSSELSNNMAQIIRTPVAQPHKCKRKRSHKHTTPKLQVNPFSSTDWGGTRTRALHQRSGTTWRCCFVAGGWGVGCV